MTNFAQELSAAAAEDPERPAVKLDDIVLSYGALDAGVARAAGLLRAKGVQPGDRVGMQLPNVPYFPIVYFGALRIGAIVVPMNPLLKDREVAYHLSDSGAEMIVAWHGFEDAARGGAEQAGAECVIVKPGEFEQMLGGADPVDDLVDRADDDPAVIIYTSGTTGTPKGATLMHSNLASGADTARDLVDAGPDSVGMATLPLFHVFGMNSVMNMAVHCRGLITLLPRFEPGKALEIVQRDGVSTFLGVPTMYAALLDHPDRDSYDVSTLDLCVSGGAAMPVEVMKSFEEAFGCEVLEGYGLSETSPVASFNQPGKERKPGSIGTPIEGVEMKLVDDEGEDVEGTGEEAVGEIAIKGHNIMKGYWKKEDATKEVLDEDGWFRSGDMAYVDDDGYFFIVDRKKDMIIRGGYNVYPREIEEVLYEHPAVSEAAVIGIPDDSKGEEVGAAVVLKDGEDVDADELRDYVKERVANYKYPRKIWFPDELPKGPTGKILKREIEVPEQVAG